MPDPNPLRDPETRERLLAEARAATPGPWVARSSISHPSDVLTEYDEAGDYLVICEHAGDDAAHIANWSPATAIAALELIGRYEDAIHVVFNGRHECSFDPATGPVWCRVCEAEMFLDVDRPREEGDVAF